MTGALTDRTLELLKAAQLEKAATFQTSTGLVNYDLELAAKNIWPFAAPLVKSVPRVKSNMGDTATRWKAITAIDTGKLPAGVAEGQRGGQIAVTLLNYTAAYAVLGQETVVTFEADEAAEGFDNARAKAAVSLINSMKMAEERVILGGNADNALGVTPTPTGALVAGGAMTAQATVAYCVALTPDGYRRASVAGGVVTTITRTNQDGTTSTMAGGAAQISAESAAVTTAGGNLSIAWTVTAVPGAAGYAWYTGLTGAGVVVLAAITTTNVFTQTANATGTQHANATGLSSDNSADSLVYDGLLTIATKSGSGSYVKSLNNGTLTSDGASGIVEIDAALQAFYNPYLLSPTKIWVSYQEAININKKVIANGGAPLIRFAMDAQNLQTLSFIAGTAVGSYYNKFTQQIIPMEIHPFLTPGTILMTTSQLPYTVPDVPSEVFRIKARREYYQIDWPLVTRQYQTGVYVSEVLQHYAPFSLGVIYNIANG
jgi:hypothetical protein